MRHNFLNKFNIIIIANISAIHMSYNMTNVFFEWDMSNDNDQLYKTGCHFERVRLFRFIFQTFNNYQVY